MATTPTTDDGVLLRRAVCSNPADDTARLVYADWLTEHGEGERGEFIRLSFAELPHNPRFGQWDKRAEDAIGRWGELAFLNPGWFPLAFGDWAVGNWPTVSCFLRDGHNSGFDVRAGFMESLACTAADFLKHAKAIFAAHPVTAVRLADKTPLDDAGVASYFNEPPGPAENWYWLDGGGQPDMSWQLPPELWDKDNTDFRSEVAATEWLSRRCVAYGRELAGLPPLPAEVVA